MGIYSFHRSIVQRSLLLTYIPKLSRLTGWKTHFYGRSQRINFLFFSFVLFFHNSFFYTFQPHLKICTIESLNVLTHSSASIDFGCPSFFSCRHTQSIECRVRAKLHPRFRSLDLTLWFMDFFYFSASPLPISHPVFNFI